MTATARPPATQEASFERIRIEELFESPLNPRKYFPHDEQQELIDSIKQHGILTPLIARYAEGGFEIAAGHRRFRAAKKAKLSHLPVILRHLTDQEMLEILTIENLQRVDVSELEEASGFQMLIDRAGYDVPRIADRINKSEKYVYDRLKLLTLGEPARKALEEGKINASHGILLARLEPADQKEVLQDAFRYKEKGETPSVRQFNDQIERQVRERKREDEFQAAVKKAKEDYPKEKVTLLSDHYGARRPNQLDRGQWQEAREDTPGRMVGVVEGDQWGNSKPKVIFFTKPKASAVRGGKGGTSGVSQAERDRRSKHRRNLRFAGDVATRLAIVGKIGSITEHQLWAEVASHIAGSGSFLEPPVFRALGEMLGITLKVGDFSNASSLLGQIPKLTVNQLQKLVLFCLVSGTPVSYQDSHQKERAKRLAKQLKLDLPKAIAEAEQRIRAEGKAPAPQASAKVRTPPKRPRVTKAVRRRAKGARR